jgi:hypothetical protein
MAATGRDCNPDANPGSYARLYSKAMQVTHNYLDMLRDYKFDTPRPTQFCSLIYLL